METLGIAGKDNMPGLAIYTSRKTEESTWSAPELLNVSGSHRDYEPTLSPDGKTLFVNSQHPSSSNPFPYNNSLTYAITGWDIAISAIESARENAIETSSKLIMYPMPVSRELKFSETIDAAIYDGNGQRMKVFRGMKSIDLSDLKPGMYFLKPANGEIHRLIIE